ncbi:MAG: DUF1801 domain-containing protein [Colwellia sp.]|nr:DUF1801 domain-containing protein [Colwellia sp.]
MKSNASSCQEYINSLDDDRKLAITQLRQVIVDNLPKGFQETISYGMLGFVVPHSLYPNGYHCDPSLPLPFINIASQKNFISLYHMCIYSDNNLLEWFKNEYPKYCKNKLDMGKSCIRFKKIDNIPYQLIGELAAKITVKQWIERYEQSMTK